MIYIIQGQQQLKENKLPASYWYVYKFPIAVKVNGKRKIQEIDQFDIREGLTFNRKQYITV